MLREEPGRGPRARGSGVGRAGAPGRVRSVLVRRRWVQRGGGGGKDVVGRGRGGGVLGGGGEGGKGGGGWGGGGMDGWWRGRGIGVGVRATRHPEVKDVSCTAARGLSTCGWGSPGTHTVSVVFVVR